MTRDTNFFCKVGIKLEDAYQRYENQLLKSIAPLPSKGSLKELNARIATIALTPLLFPVLGMGYLLGSKLINHQISHIVLRLDKKITSLKNSALPKWQQEAINEIAKTRFDNPAHELQRLRKNKILTSKIESELETAIKTVDPLLWHDCIRKRQIKVIMGQALEIKSIYSKTHHVFIHAQGSNWLGLNYLVKELHKTFHESDDVSHFKFLRPPCKLAEPGMASTLWKTVRNTFLDEEKVTNIREYIDSKWYVSDNDGETREHLLSTDAYFLNPQKFESSLFFLVNNSNILGKTDTIKFFYKKIIKHYRPNLSDLDLSRLANKVFNATKEAKGICGNLFTICIPKEKSLEVQYRAHPFGAVCACHPETEALDILNKLQRESFENSTKCDSWLGCQIPQFRLYTPRLKPGETPIYLLTPNQKASRKKMKSLIKNIAAEIFQNP